MMKVDTFISYSSADKATADAVCIKLEAIGLRCWIAARDVVPGQEYAAAIIDAIDHSRVMVLIFSARANASHQIHREIERAASKGIPIVPLRIEDVIPTESMEYFLGGIHWLDAITSPLEPHLRRLAETVEAILLRLDGGGKAAPLEGNNLTQTPQRVPGPLRTGRVPRPALLFGAALLAVTLAAGLEFVRQSYQSHLGEATDSPSLAHLNRPPSNEPALLISPVTKDRVRPLAGYPVIDISRLIFAEGARFGLELTVPSNDTHIVTVRSIMPIIKYSPGENPTFSYTIASKAIGGSGVAEARRFIVRLNGDRPAIVSWIDDSGQRRLAKPNNLLESGASRFLTLSDKDPVELLDISVVAMQSGTYDVGFKIQYAVNGIDMVAETLPFHIYRN